MQKVQFEAFLRFIRNRTLRFLFYSSVFGLQYNKDSDIGIVFFFHVKFNALKIDVFFLICGFQFFVAIDILISLKNVRYQTSI